jgi:hypothetical protein
MWSRLALIAALGLAPSQAGKLELTNVRATYGVLGAPRPDNKVLHGDAFWVAFDVDNLKVDAGGKAVYSMGIEYLDSKGKVMGAEKGRSLDAILSLGGSRVPASAHAQVGFDTAPGEYAIRVTVTDEVAKTSAVLERKFQVQPLTFGLVRVRTTYDQGGNVAAPMVGVPGQVIYAHWLAVGYERDKAKKSPNFQVELSVLDEKGKPVLAKPDTLTVNEKTNVPETQRALEMWQPIQLNRSGKFTVELKGTDNVSKKTATVRFPLTVVGIEK